jgi:CBS domain containing-hemolysin-like protein
MAKHLGKVPIPGSVVEVGGLVFQAEEATGRRKKVGTVLIRPVEPEIAGADDDRLPEETRS